MNLYSADTSIKRTSGHRNGADLSPKTCIELTLQEILQWIFVILLEERAVLNIGVRAFFFARGAVNHLPKKFSQVAQIFTRQSKRNEGNTMH